MDRNKFEDIEIGGKAFRISKERTFIASCYLERIQRTRPLGIDDLIKADTLILRNIEVEPGKFEKQWSKIEDSDLEFSTEQGLKLWDKIKEVRKDFQKTQSKKLKDGSGK